MSKIRYVGKSAPCLACGDESGNCREVIDATQETYLCMGYGSLGYKETFPGADGRVWMVSKAAGGSYWITTHPDKKQEFTEAAREQWAQGRAALKERFERERLDALANEMSADDRDRHYRRLLSELSLSKADRQSLRDRGFSDSDIDAAGFRSVSKYQRVLGTYPVNLPGYSLNRFGRFQLDIYSDGILCPIPDAEGRWVGAQVRSTQPEKNRYKWLSKNTSAYLNGEMPVSSWDVPEPAEGARVWLAEGTGIKPKLASVKHKAPFIGAAGGLFSTSPTNTKAAIAKMLQKYGAEVLTIAVDAGDVINPDVMRRLEYQIDWLKGEGYKLEIAWWGQVTKEQDDIDEIGSLDGITYLSPDSFLLLAQQYAPQPERKEIPRPVLKERTERRQDEIAAEKREKMKEPVVRPDGWAVWMRLREYTPDLVQDSQFVSFDAPEPGVILGVKSGLGSGKTYQLELLFGPGGAYEHKGAIALFARNSLIYNFVTRIERFAHLNDELLLLMRDPTSCLALCTNSLKKFANPEWFDGKILIIDEFWAVAQHIACSATHKRDRLQALELLKEAFVRCEAVITLDGMLTDWLMEWAGKLALGTKKIIKLENKAIRRKAKVEILLGTPTKTGKFDDMNISPYVAPMMGANEPFIVFTDSQKLGEQIEGMLTASGKKGLRIDSKTVFPGSDARICLDNCNKWIKANRPDFITCSPTSESGVDISVFGYFKHSYGLFRGVLTTDSQMQMMGRYRCPDCLWHISVPKQSFLGDDGKYNIENLQAAADRVMALADGDLSELRLNKDWLGEQFFKYVEEASRDYNNQFAFKVNGKNSFERKNLRECLVFALESSGHEIEQIWDFAQSETEANLKVASEEVKKRTASDIFNAPDITEQEAEKLAASWSATWEQRVSVIKLGYIKQLPGIENTEQWTQDLIQYLKYDHPKMIPGANILYQFLHPEVATKKQLNVWARIATERAVYLPDLQSPLLKVRALEALKFERFLDPSKLWHKDSPELIELTLEGNKKKHVNALGFNVPVIAKGPSKGKADGIRYLRRILELVGLRLGPCHKKRIDGKVINTYALDESWLSDPVWVAVQQAVERKYTEFDTEWIRPEILTIAPAEAISNQQDVSALEDLSNEPETDPDGIDWRGKDLELNVNVVGLPLGSTVKALSQPRRVSQYHEDWTIWVQSAIGRILLELRHLSLHFEPSPG